MKWPDLLPLAASRQGAWTKIIEDDDPDLVFLCGDRMGNGLWSKIKGVRDCSDVPLVVAVEGSEEMEVVKALELGADEHIRLPCNLMEIVARVAALMRRVGRTRLRPDSKRIQCGVLLIDPSAHEVFMGSTRLNLTPTEFKLLHLLARNRHVTLPRAFIKRTVWSDEVEAGDALKKYIQRLRRKLGDDARNPLWIKNVHGVGYRFGAPSTNAA
jgi:DNA-binding response OmpR family regulator